MGMPRKLLLVLLLLTLVIEFRLFVLSTSHTTSVSINNDGDMVVHGKNFYCK